MNEYNDDVKCARRVLGLDGYDPYRHEDDDYSPLAKRLARAVLQLHERADGQLGLLKSYRAKIKELHAALQEALGWWERWEATGFGGVNDARISELRKLLDGGVK